MKTTRLMEGWVGAWRATDERFCYGYISGHILSLYDIIDNRIFAKLIRDI